MYKKKKVGLTKIKLFNEINWASHVDIRTGLENNFSFFLKKKSKVRAKAQVQEIIRGVVTPSQSARIHMLLPGGGDSRVQTPNA